ncbi:hypothetical protein B1B05_04405 [Domibacillus enclensis]|uniref:Uncharacterized protein n=1 Tax=Domibacillus enclensis TaxID=1017273 RepID=A0ABX4EAH7_9BACI|nr:hypothetical protein B1B05_04405 [Domibacillus enclensis]
MLAPTQYGRLLQDFAFGGAGGELTFVAMLQKWISPDPLIPPESSSCASRPGGEEKQIVKPKIGIVLIGKKETRTLCFSPCRKIRLSS